MDPRFDKHTDLKAVELSSGQFLLAGIAEMKGAESESAAFSAAHEKNWFNFYVKSTDTSGSDSRFLNVWFGLNAAGGSAVAAKFVGEVLSTTAAAGVGGLDAWGTLDAAAESPTGLIYGMCAAVIAQARTAAKTLTGVYWALFLASSFEANVTTSDESAFIGCQDWGSGDKMPHFLDVAGLTSGAGNAWDATHSTPSTCVGYLRVRTPLGTKGIPVYTIA